MLNVRPPRSKKGPLVLLVMLLASGCAALAGLGDFSEGNEDPEDSGSPGFVVAVEPSTIVLAPKEDMSATVTIAANPPLRQDAFVRVDGLPPGVTAAPVAIARPSGSTAKGTLVFHADADAGRAAGESQVVASAEPLHDEAPIQVRVLGPPIVFDTPKAAPFIVPEGITAIYVKIWGAGGGAGMNGATGGAGGFVFGRIDVTPGEVLTLRIGAGGGAGTGSEDAGAASGGGGAGLTGVFRSTTALMIAGSGGGGGAVGYSGGIITNGAGAGGGGGADGGAGGGPTGAAGGTGANGGAAGSNGSCGDAGATAGRALFGGTGAGGTPGGPGGDAGGGDGRRAELGGGGGGGAGAFGGGGGGCGTSVIAVKYGGGGGGGGSSLAPGKEARVLDGNGVTPGGNRDVDYDGRAGKGGAVGANGPEPGAPGRIVIRY
ncbi:hypothetical protein LZC95_24295 [Pendulispora brunnea]|uniref:Uncharacterized protein n=1 Tax=Pendulispora brunnea TaxID=2905690 RepID=A0ABZ2KRJ3_9BACT